MTENRSAHRPRVAEFFAGIGLVRAGLERAGFDVVWANDIERTKRHIYAANFDPEHYVLGDVRDVRGGAIPDVDLATASFPCTDLSLAGNRAGFAGTQSSMFWEFARVLSEMGPRRPPVVMLENVPSFATSHGGADLRAALEELHRLGYATDLMVLDARFFVPQSRPRLFVIGAVAPLSPRDGWDSPLRPPWVKGLAARYAAPQMMAFPIIIPTAAAATIGDVIDHLTPDDHTWWDGERVAKFEGSLSPIQAARLDGLRQGEHLQWATAYRRTRHGKATWEIRADAIAGCLRTARGGSSKQALVEGGQGQVRVRWLSAREYARLQGAPDFDFGSASEGQAIFGLGDAVCVPAVTWIAERYLIPLVKHSLPMGTTGVAAAS